MDEALAHCNLTEVANKLVGTLSKGYQQRVGIAQAIVHRPDLVILDEPTVGLDPNQIREIRSLIRENKVAQMYSAIQTGAQLGMQTLDQNLQDLVKRNIVSVEEARGKAMNKDSFR